MPLLSNRMTKLWLKEIKLTADFFKKVIIRNDISQSFYNDDGIMDYRLLDFLLNNVDLF